MIDMIYRSLGLCDQASNSENLSCIEKTTATLGMDPQKVVPILAELLSIPLNNAYSTPIESTPQQKKKITLDTLVAVLQAMAEQHFVLLIVEDLQWIDPSTLELLSKLVTQPGLTNIFTLLTFRNEFTPPWHSQANLTLITLNRLTRKQSGRLIGQLCSHKTLPADVFNEIINKTDGIPFFVEELTNTVLRSDLLNEKEDYYELNMPMSRLGIPSTLQDSLMSRLDSLGEDKELAQLSSILGRDFDHELLSAVSTHGEQRLQMGLNRLINAELFFQRGKPPASQYSFRHALLRETAYQSLLIRTRQTYHQRIAILLKERFPNIISDNPELMAHHCTEAGEYTEAIHYWLAAGRHAVQRSANLEAISHLRNGLLIIDKHPDSSQRTDLELAIQITLGLAVMMSKGYAAPEAEHAYARARELCKDIIDLNAVFPVLCGLWEYYVVRADLTNANNLAHEIHKISVQSHQPNLKLEAHRILGTTQLWQGRLAEALENLQSQEIQTLLAPNNIEAQVSYCQDARVATLANTSVVLWLLGYPDQALERAYLALDLAKKLSHPFSQAYALQFLGTVLQLRGDYKTAGQYADILIALSETYGFPYWAATAKMLRAWVATNDTNANITSARYQDAVNEYEASGNQLARPYFLTLLSTLHIKAGNLEAAKSTIDVALEETELTGEKFFMSELLRMKGELVLSDPYQSDFTVAENLFMKAIDCALQQSAKSLALRAAISLAKLWEKRDPRQDCRGKIISLLGQQLSDIQEGQHTADILAAQQLLAVT